MAYLKISVDDGITYTDYSDKVTALSVSYIVNSTEKVNAAGNTVIDLINRKQQIDVSFKPLTNIEMADLITKLDNYVVKISFLDAKSGALKEGIKCKVSTPSADYYCILSDKVMFNSISVTFNEL